MTAFSPLRLLLVAGLCATAWACSDDPSLEATLAWQLHCPLGDCTGYADRVVSPAVADAEQRLICRISDLADGRVLIDELSVERFGSDPHTLAIRDAVVAKGGGSATDPGCSVSVKEDDTYSGACDGASSPCTFDSIAFEGKRGDRTVRAALRCTGLRGEGDTRRRRDLGAPGSDGRQPLSLEFVHCD